MRQITYPALRAVMAEHGHTRKDLSKLLNLSPCGVSRRFAKKTDWTISEMLIISKHYGKSLDELFGS